MKKRILFFITDLGGGGAENVLVNLVNNLDYSKYDITLLTLFGGGVNESRLNSEIKLKHIFPFPPFRGFSSLQKLFSPTTLRKFFIRGVYDVEIAYLQHTPTRILSGASLSPETKRFAWVHTKNVSPFKYRSVAEMEDCYNKYTKIAFVSEIARDAFQTSFNVSTPLEVVHNVVESTKIISSGNLPFEKANNNTIKLCTVGRLNHLKGYDRLISVLHELSQEGLRHWHLSILGTGELEIKLKKMVDDFNLGDNVEFMGYKTNPYVYIKNSDCFICSSYTEGYSTAVTEAIILGVPVVTTDCSGMSEILGDSGAGIITENNEEALKNGIREIISNPDKLKSMTYAAIDRSKHFSTKSLVAEFEKFISK